MSKGFEVDNDSSARMKNVQSWIRGDSSHGNKAAAKRLPVFPDRTASRWYFRSYGNTGVSRHFFVSPEPSPTRLTGTTGMLPSFCGRAGQLPLAAPGGRSSRSHWWVCHDVPGRRDLTIVFSVVPLANRWRRDNRSGRAITRVVSGRLRLAGVVQFTVIPFQFLVE